MAPSLVLNASYEPLSVVPSRRAAVLVLAEKADLLHDTGGVGDGAGVGHGVHGGEAAARGGGAARGDGLGVLASGFAQVGVQVDQAG